VSRTSIASDITCIRSQAKETIKEYTTEYLPEQYRVCLSALDTILKHAYEILQTSHDNREKLQAMDIQRHSSSKAGVTVQCYNH
jgi:hypothetical protein